MRWPLATVNQCHGSIRLSDEEGDRPLASPPDMLPRLAATCPFANLLYPDTGQPIPNTIEVLFLKVTVF
jgi:hypothetical protein